MSNIAVNNAEPILFVVYLGGKVAEDRMGEDHEVVVVVATSVAAARAAAKKKWRGIGSPHVDAVKQLDVVDGHRVMCVPSMRDNSEPVDPTWVP